MHKSNSRFKATQHSSLFLSRNHQKDIEGTYFEAVYFIVKVA